MWVQCFCLFRDLCSWTIYVWSWSTMALHNWKGDLWWIQRLWRHEWRATVWSVCNSSSSSSSSLRQDHPRMCAVTRGHFRSRDKDGDYTTRSAIVENPMLHVYSMALCFIEPELLPVQVLHCRTKALPFWPLWPWPWSDDLHIQNRPVVPGNIPHVRIWTSNVKASKVIVLHTYRHTDTNKYTTQLREWSTSDKKTGQFVTVVTDMIT